MKNYRKPLAILVLLLVFAGVAYWDEWKTKKDIEIAKDKDRLIDLKASDTSEIHYQKRVGTAPPIDIRLSKVDGKWKVVEPSTYPADNETVERWLKTIEDLRYEKAFDATAEKLKDYGLDHPQISIGLKSDKHQEVSLLIGSKSPVGYSSYIKLGHGPSLYLVSHYLFTASNKELADFRDKSLGLPKAADIQGFTYSKSPQPQAAIRLKRQGKDWVIEAPLPGKADPQEVAGFLSFFERQKVERFIDDPSPEMSKALSTENQGSHLRARLQLELVGGQSIAFSFLENNGVIYTQLPGQKGFVALDKNFEEGLNKSLKDFQFRGMFSFNSTEVKQVEIDGKIYEKKADQWFAAGANEPAEFVRLLLVDLEFSKADEILTKERAASVIKEKPAHHVKLSLNDNSAVIADIWTNPASPQTVYVRRNDEAYFLARAEMLDNFGPQAKPVEKSKVGGQP